MSLSIIIPTYNSQSLIESTLDTIDISSDYLKEIIIVDNGSRDATVDIIKNRYPKVILITNLENRGASAARNQGITIAKGKYVMCMDCDVRLKENFILNLIHILTTLDDSVAAIAPQIIQAHTEKLFSCGIVISDILRAHDLGKNMAKDSLGSNLTIDGPNSCCAIYRKTALDAIKEKSYFDEDFFFLFEDVDIAFRMKKKGFKTLYASKLYCYHSENSSGFSPQLRRYLCFRNRLYLICKHVKEKRVLFFLRSLPYDLLRTIHMLFTNRYTWKIFKDLYCKIKNEKSLTV